MTVRRRQTISFWILTVLVAAEAAAAFKMTMLTAGLKRLIEIYDRPESVGWLLTSYLLVSAGCAAVGGRLGDLYGRKRVLGAALALSASGSAISVISTGLDGVILGRALEGFSGAVLPLCIGLVREHALPRREAFGIGVVSAAAPLGSGLGYLIGGLVIAHFGWRGIFVVSGVLSAMIALLACVILPASMASRSHMRLDVIGGLLFLPAMAALLLAVSNLRSWGWSDPRSIALTTGGLLLVAFWVRHELRHPNPLFDVRLLGDRRVALANVFSALMCMTAFQFTPCLLLLIQQPTWTGIGLGMSPSVAGLLPAPGMFAGVAMGVAGGWLGARFGRRLVLFVGGAAAICAWSLLLGLIGDASTPAVLAVAILSAGANALIYVGVATVIVSGAPSARTSEAAGFASVVKTVSLAVGAQTMLTVLSLARVSDPTGLASYPAPQAYMLWIGLVVAVSLFALAIILAIPARAVGPATENGSGLARGRLPALRKAPQP